MMSLSLHLPDDLQARLAARATECGHDTVEAYVEALIREDTAADETMADEDLEQLLLQRLARAQTVEFTHEFVADFRLSMVSRSLPATQSTAQE